MKEHYIKQMQINPVKIKLTILCYPYLMPILIAKDICLYSHWYEYICIFSIMYTYIYTHTYIYKL